jgi:uncharacterized protein YeaO (DUF488 family)
MKITVKRAYDEAARSDGTRVLADRLWPRGVSKEDAEIDAWPKDLAPSNALRAWFHKDPEGRYKEFAQRYRKELAPKKEEGKEVIAGRKTITLVTAVKDPDCSHIPTLTAFLKKLS